MSLRLIWDSNEVLKNLQCARFVKVLVVEIFSSVLGLFGLIIGLLTSGKAHDFKS